MRRRASSAISMARSSPSSTCGGGASRRVAVSSTITFLSGVVQKQLAAKFRRFFRHTPSQKYTHVAAALRADAALQQSRWAAFERRQASELRRRMSPERIEPSIVAGSPVAVQSPASTRLCETPSGSGGRSASSAGVAAKVARFSRMICQGGSESSDPGGALHVRPQRSGPASLAARRADGRPR